jgi:hypothetical protein
VAQPDERERPSEQVPRLPDQDERADEGERQVEHRIHDVLVRSNLEPRDVGRRAAHEQRGGGGEDAREDQRSPTGVRGDVATLSHATSR